MGERYPDNPGAGAYRRVDWAGLPKRFRGVCSSVSLAGPVFSISHLPAPAVNAFAKRSTVAALFPMGLDQLPEIRPTERPVMVEHARLSRN